MGFSGKATSFCKSAVKRFKLDSHHAIERFRVVFTCIATVGLVVISAAGVSAWSANNESLAHTSLYGDQANTSKTGFQVDVDGVYRSTGGDRALVVMHFAPSATVSYNAADYQAYLLGSDPEMNSQRVSTPGVRGSIYMFGSTGYLGVLLDADMPFDKQVLNLTMRANKELSYKERTPGGDIKAQTSDATFAKYDQWRVFFNPGATAAMPIPALDTSDFDPARAYYDVVVRPQEQESRDKLDEKLLEMRARLTQIGSYTTDLQTTKVDGLFLRPPVAPKAVANDKVTGVSRAEAKGGDPTLALKSGYTVSGGFNFNWRAGNVYDGYLDSLVRGRSYVDFLAKKRNESPDTITQQIADMPWILSDGSDLKQEYQPSDVTMRPLASLMTGLSQAYSDYSRSKTEYQSELLLDLLRLDVQLRAVKANGTVRDDAGTLTVF